MFKRLSVVEFYEVTITQILFRLEGKTMIYRLRLINSGAKKILSMSMFSEKKVLQVKICKSNFTPVMLQTIMK